MHRVGELKTGDNIVLVVTASAHRQDAFDAAGFLMDYFKTRAPFWKKETTASGESGWVEARAEDEDACETLALIAQNCDRIAASTFFVSEVLRVGER